MLKCAGSVGRWEDPETEKLEEDRPLIVEMVADNLRALPRGPVCCHR